MALSEIMTRASSPEPMDATRHSSPCRTVMSRTLETADLCQRLVMT